jgi:hypothetical protein
MSKAAVPREFLGAFKRGHRASSKEFIDEELSIELLQKAEAGDKEAEAALRWLTRFNNEFHKGVIKKGDTKALHLTDEMRRDCNRRNYARRNDMFTCAIRVDVPAEYANREFFIEKFKK